MKIETPQDLRKLYYQLVVEGLLVELCADEQLLRRMIDQHVDKVVAVYVGEANMTAGDEVLGRFLLAKAEEHLSQTKFKKLMESESPWEMQ